MAEIKNRALFEEYAKYVCELRKKEIEKEAREYYIETRDMGNRPRYKLNRAVSKDPDFIRLLAQRLDADEVISGYKSGTLDEDDGFTSGYAVFEDVLLDSVNPPHNHSKKLFAPFSPADRELLGNVKQRYLKRLAQEYAEGIDLKKHVKTLVFDGFYRNYEKCDNHIRRKNNFMRTLGLEKLLENDDPQYPELNEETLPRFLTEKIGTGLITLGFVVKQARGYSTVRSFLTDCVVKKSREDAYFFPCLRNEYMAILDELRPMLEEEVQNHYTPEKCASLFLQNETFRGLVDAYNTRIRAKELLRAEILDTIPEDLPDLFPTARMMRRRFYLHVGPTNSGKTYESIRDLMMAEHGAYLAPLRLLAYEQYENMNNHGVPCSLLTGEEKIILEDATHYSSTIEKADFTRRYDCVVIDEAQMMADKDRGGAWTFAILGIASEVVHLCLSPDAEELAIRVIRSCGDDYEVIYHNRKTPLIFEKKSVRFPDSIERGDALIVFSRKDVHRVAAELQSKKISCSIVYGALPYETRHREAERFARGETEVVVATDAIGMGMNLPIRRIIFLDTAKYDGHDRRLLTVSEVKQIAGRAGRYGIYDRGYVNSIYDRGLVASSLSEEVESLKEAVIGFPELLLKLDMPLSVIMEHWISLPCPAGYVRYDLEEEIFLARILEKYSDDKEQIYRLVTIPFAENSDVLMAIWKELSLQVLSGRSCELRPLIPETRKMGGLNVNERLGIFEEDYHICDLLFNFSEKFELGIFSGDIMERKREISDSITELLVEQNLRPRKCRKCGRNIAWDYHFGVCQQCFERMRTSRGPRSRHH